MRYFYTDYRIAEWMEEWHGIWSNHDVKTHPSPPDENSDGRSLLSADSEIKWYIDKSCYQMLNPQVGDIIQDRNVIEEVYKIHADFNEVWSRGAIFYPPFKIIQRDDKAFFMPETEETNV